MKSYLAKAGEVERKWYVVDAAGKPLGRVASQVASILRGKNKPEFTTNVDTGEEFIYISPLIDKHYSENPFRTETRTLPINFDYLTTYMQMVEIKIPEGYVVDEMPKPARMVMNDNDIVLTYRLGVDGNVIKVNYVYQLKKIIFPATDYDGIRDFFAKLVAKNSEQIVLKKASAVDVVKE